MRDMVALSVENKERRVSLARKQQERKETPNAVVVLAANICLSEGEISEMRVGQCRASRRGLGNAIFAVRVSVPNGFPSWDSTSLDKTMCVSREAKLQPDVDPTESFSCCNHNLLCENKNKDLKCDVLAMNTLSSL